MRFVAIDQGTTSTRALVATTDGQAHIVCSLRHNQEFPHTGWVEHNGLELLENVKTCIAAAGPVDAIGIDNQGESCLGWDALTGEPVSPVIVWQDNRTMARIDSLRAEGAEPLTLGRAGLPLDAYFSAAKLAWILANVPAARAAHSAGRLRLGTTDAFFLDRLCGRFVTDPTTASRTSLLNLETCSWDEDLCRLFGVPIETLPEIVPTAATVLGYYTGIPVTASVVDQQAALYGHGCRKASDAKITFGTGAFALTLTGSEIVRAPEIGLLPTIAWQTPHETVYAVDGGVYDAGSVVEWLKRLGMIASVDELVDFPQTSAIDRGLVFVPALSGLACPYWDRSAAGMWLGMSADTTPRDLCQAALEGVALCATEVIDAIQKRQGVSRVISVDGGLSRNVYFMQFLTDTLGRTIRVPNFHELSSFGCAALAALALNVELVPPDLGVTTYLPQRNASEKRRTRFAEAIKRSRGWQQVA